MCDLMVGLFEHLDITYALVVYLSIKYTQKILTGPELKKYHVVLLVCKEMEWGYTIDHWNFIEAKDVNMEDLWT